MACQTFPLECRACLICNLGVYHVIYTRLLPPPPMQCVTHVHDCTFSSTTSSRVGCVNPMTPPSHSVRYSSSLYTMSTASCMSSANTYTCAFTRYLLRLFMIAPPPAQPVPPHTPFSVDPIQFAWSLCAPC